MESLTDEPRSSLSSICSNCRDSCLCSCESIKATTYRLKWNWFYVIALGALVSIGASSPMGTLHEFVTNPRATGASGQQFEPGLGLSEEFYSWVISINNIGGFLGGIAGVIFTSLLPYWFSFMISVVCHTLGFLLYAVVTQGWMLITGRLLVGIFTGLHRALTFAYFAVTYEYYIREKQDSKKFCRLKDLLFALYSVSTSVGYLIGAGVSVIFSRIDHIDHFRVIGWCNTALGFAFIVMLTLTFHGEFKRNGRHSYLSLSLIRSQAAECCQKSNIITQLIVVFLILCTAVIKSRVTIYEELFNPILSDSFGFSEDNTVYFFLVILVAPILGGLFLTVIQWTRVNNIIIALFGIIATIVALLLTSDWQATLKDDCLEYSLYHNPHFGSGTELSLHEQQCWNSTSKNSTKPEYHLAGFNGGHLEVILLPKEKNTLMCDIYLTAESCDPCNTNKTFKASLLVDPDSDEYCLKDNTNTSTASNKHNEMSIKCHGGRNESCDAVCLHLYKSNPRTLAAVQDYKDSVVTKMTFRSLVEDVYAQSLEAFDRDVYAAAMKECEAHKKEQCHWIPNSPITREHCGDCQPICRGKSQSLDFVQFSVGAFWFMFSMPVAEVSLPLLISDSVREEYQGIVMGITVASSELLQSINPLWVNTAYEASGKRTFLPNIILIAMFLPFLFGLCLLYQTLIRLQRSIHSNF